MANAERIDFETAARGAESGRRRPWRRSGLRKTMRLLCLAALVIVIGAALSHGGWPAALVRAAVSSDGYANAPPLVSQMVDAYESGQRPFVPEPPLVSDNGLDYDAPKSAVRNTGAGSIIVSNSFVNLDKMSLEQLRAEYRRLDAENHDLNVLLGRVSRERDMLMQLHGNLRDRVQQLTQEVRIAEEGGGDGESATGDASTSSAGTAGSASCRRQLAQLREASRQRARDLEQVSRRCRAQALRYHKLFEALQRRDEDLSFTEWLQSNASDTQAMKKTTADVLPQARAEIHQLLSDHAEWMAALMQRAGGRFSTASAALFTYGSLAVPAALCALFLSRNLHWLTASPWITAGNLFFAAFTAYLLVFRWWSHTDPLQMMQIVSPASFLFVQFLLALTYPPLLVLQLLQWHRRVSVVATGASSRPRWWAMATAVTREWRPALQLVAAAVLATDYYRHCWSPSMRDVQVDASWRRYGLWASLCAYVVVMHLREERLRRGGRGWGSNGSGGGGGGLPATAHGAVVVDGSVARNSRRDADVYRDGPLMTTEASQAGVELPSDPLNDEEKMA
ncbi:hypothetical protein CDCA_CDCA11G3242 [Cyanidium caldarium]|uniref:Uncharacterized protein n=1 Tax=Cyanidium caldarium TaxID=2771 RepID=A0AAV9IY63_CYACA|nr:hypothetical protein CDCA_CDCA11G3242 [Cyanidium caldarium]